jgi:hypothetical protein
MTTNELEHNGESLIDRPSNDVLSPPFHQLIWELVNTEMAIADPTSGMVQIVEQVEVDMPVEIRVEVDEQGQVRLMGSPPTQRTETTILPVFHQMKLRISQEAIVETASSAEYH